MPSTLDTAQLLGQMDTAQLLAVAAALGWASGLRLYARDVPHRRSRLLRLGVELPQGLHVLQHPLMLGASGLMLFVEFFADKIPGVDTLWDMVHTLVRIPAGAALAAAVFGADQATWATLAALLGGTLAATSHVAKATTRAAVNTSPEPFSNIGMSLAGDAFVPTVLWLSWTHPVLLAGGARAVRPGGDRPDRRAGQVPARAAAAAHQVGCVAASLRSELRVRSRCSRRS
jgi:hypothetical protein